MKTLLLRVIVVTLVAFVIVTGISGGGVAAQEGTPVSDMSPNPEDCTWEPRTVEELQAIHGTPAPEGAGEATSAARDASPETFALPVGEPADAQIAEEIRAVVHHLVACHNAGNYLAGFTGVTDQFLESQVGLALFDEDFVAAMNAEPVPLEEEQQTILLDVREVVVYEDGRVGALFDYIGPTPQPEGIGGVETDLFIFAEVDGEWKLDESIENLESQHGPVGVATPAGA